MTVSNDELLGLYNPEIATYKDLALMLETSNVEDNDEGSVLAASLLQLPDVFTQNTAAAVLDSVNFHINSSERQLLEGGEWKPTREILAERFQALADTDHEESQQDPVDTDILEQTISFAEEDLEAARDFYQATADIRREDQRPLGNVEKVRMLLAALEANSTTVTPEQLMLVQDPHTAAVAARAFPAAEELLSYLSEEQLTPAEERRRERLARAERERVSAGGNRQLAESNDLEIMIMLDEAPEVIASMALNTHDVKPDQLVEILEDAPNEMIANWLFGLEVQQPRDGAIEQLMSRFDDDRIRELAATCQKLIDAYEAQGGALGAMPWVVDIIQHVYVPRLMLDPASAALVWHELSDICGDDPAMWLAVLLSDTSETPTRLQDIV